MNDISRGILIVNESRRRFLQGAGGLALGIYTGAAFADSGTAAPGSAGGGLVGAGNFEPNAFVRIGTDNSVTVVAKHLEMGQGTFTGLATLVAEELDADWELVRVEGAPADNNKYKNLLMGIQLTGGSTAMANSWEQMRKAGAAARAMLVAAAAQEWKVAPASISVAKGWVHSKNGHKASFGQLALKAAQQPVPQDVALKDPKDFQLIGKQKLHRKDHADKTNGSAVFTQDYKLPDMLVAVVAHPQRFGAVPRTVNADKARAVPNVVEVVQFGGDNKTRFSGVAVLAKNTWAARSGRDALEIDWDESGAFRLGSEQIMAQYREMAGKDGLVARKEGDAAAAFAAKPAKLIEAEYELPYLAHSAMEPLNCLVKLGDGSCEIVNGEQMHTPDQGAVAALLGITPDKVSITQLYAGGSFGRRANPHADYVLEAVAIAKAAWDKGVKVPVKLVWTREDDTRAGYYRPMFFHKARLGLDGGGKLVAWQHHVVAQSIIKGTAFEGFMVKDGIDATSVEGVADMPYAVPNLRVELSTPDNIGVPVQWWRSVGHSANAFVKESLVDEAAVAAGQDPYEYRRALLGGAPRLKAVLELAAAKADWGRPLKPGAAGEKRGRGIAVHESFNSYVAQVAEVTVKPDGSFKVDRVVCAVDCGVAINPDVVAAQMQGGIGYGLSAALHGAITLKDGVVQESNFHQYIPLRINEMPAVEVHIVPSAEKPTGVGEPGTPPIAPALCNALFNATGKRIRRLPVADQMSA
ncbi:MAG TPA: xanthine dehydrogenase family protein molybdopterin-binding subunit [Nevskia sp.]|nr:xanthine dehydrogenase family protein molybdopterin-binding subunit [Nevskia sp.]